MNTDPLIAHAKRVRGLLKKHFPDVPFSVRTDRFAGGTSLHIRPTMSSFQPELNRELYFLFRSTAQGTFDGMTDCFQYARKEFDGAKYVSFEGCRPNLPVLAIDMAVVDRIKADPDYQFMLK